PSMFMAFGLVILYLRERGGWAATRPMWVAWAFYLCFSASGKAYADKIVGAGHEGILSTVPSIVNPFNWSAVSFDDRSHTYHHYSVDLLRGQKRREYTFSLPEDDMAVRASLNSHEVKHFLEHARWPVVRATQTNHGWT